MLRSEIKRQNAYFPHGSLPKIGLPITVVSPGQKCQPLKHAKNSILNDVYKYFIHVHRDYNKTNQLQHWLASLFFVNKLSVSTRMIKAKDTLKVS